MGIVQKEGLQTTIISYLGLFLGYLNKGILFIIFLSTEEIGLINLLIGIGILFAQFSNLGSAYLSWKFFPLFKNKDNSNHGFLTLSSIIVLCGVVIFSTLYFVFEDFIGGLYNEKSQQFIHYYYWVLPVGIGYSGFILFENYLRSLSRNTFSVFINDIVIRLFTTVLIICFGMEWISFITFVYSIMISYLIPPFILFFYTVIIGEGKLSLKSINIRKPLRRIMLTYSLYSYINSLGTLLVITLDAMMVASMLGLKETGIYTTVVFLSSALIIPYRSLNRVCTPIVAQHWKDKNLIEMDSLYKRSSSIMLALVLFMFLAIWINRIELFSFLPSEYSAGIVVFLCLMVGRIIDVYFGINGTIFVTSKKYRFDVVFTLILIVLVFILNLWLIPMWGMKGAAVSTSIAYIVYNMGRMLFIKMSFGMHPFKFSQLKTFVLFTLIYLLFEFAPFEFENRYIALAVRSSVLILLTIIPLIVFKIEPEITNYLSKSYRKITSRKP